MYMYWKEVPSLSGLKVVTWTETVSNENISNPSNSDCKNIKIFIFYFSKLDIPFFPEFFRFQDVAIYFNMWQHQIVQQGAHLKKNSLQSYKLQN